MTDIPRLHEAVTRLPSCDRTDLAIRYPRDRVAAHAPARTKSAF
jgi:hypothetical protein